MPGHKWKKPWLKFVDTYEKNSKNTVFVKSNIRLYIIRRLWKVVMYDQRRSILEINTNNSDDFKRCYKAKIIKMIETIVNNKNKIVKEVFKSNSVRKSL